MAHRGGGCQSFLGAQTFQYASFCCSFHCFSRGQCRHEKSASFFHHARAFFVEKRSVLNRRNARAHGQLVPSVPCACAATFRSSLLASSTSAFNSSKLY